MEMSKGQSDNKNIATKKFDWTAVADRLRTISWSNYSHPTGVVNLAYGLNLPTPRNSRCKRENWQHNTSNAQKSTIKKQLRTDLGRSFRVTTATQLVWLTGLRPHKI